MNPLQILLIDDHTLFRSGMRLLLLAGLPEAQVIEAESLEQAVRTNSQSPSIVLLDIQLQGVSGLEGLGLLQQRWPTVRVVMLSSVMALETVRLALVRGAAAFVSKADTAEKIITVVQQTLGGEPAGASNSNAAPDASSRLSKSRLTPRQCEVLDLPCEGLSNKTPASWAAQCHCSAR